MNNSIKIAVGFCVILVAWMAAGMLLSPDEQAMALDGSEGMAPANADTRVLVEVSAMRAEEITSYIIANGSIQPDREVVLRAETTGQIEDILVAEGAYVESGSVIMRLKMDDRSIREEQAEINLQEKQRLYEATVDLQARNFASATEVDNALTQMKLAEVELERIRLEIEKTYIRAPFSGFIEENIVDLGEYVGIGNELTRIVDNDPLVVNTYISQNDVEFLQVGGEARVELVNGSDKNGTIRFISPRANEATRTFRVEIAIDNSEGLRAGSSVSAQIPRQQVLAHYISAGLLTLNDEGQIGVKTVNPEDVVEFYPINIEMSDAEGMWVSGLPERANIITAGQGFAPIGEPVRVTWSGPSSSETTWSEPEIQE